MATASFKISDFKTSIGNLVRPNLFNATLSNYSKIVGGADSGTFPDIANT
jgi:hypothetical protein